MLKQLTVVKGCATIRVQINEKERNAMKYMGSKSRLSKELAPGESNEVTLHTSKLLTSTDDNTFDNQSEMRGIVEIIVPQNKSGNRGVVRLVWLPKYLRFSSIDDTNIKNNYVYKNGKTFKRYQLNG